MLRIPIILIGWWLLVAIVLATMAHAQMPAVTENLVGGAASSSSNTAVTIISAPSGTRRIYVTAAQCGRTDAGTSAVYVTFNDNASTILVLASGGGGGGNNMVSVSPLPPRLHFSSRQ